MAVAKATVTEDAKTVEKWAANAVQWVRTARTNLYHAMGQFEIGGRPKMAREMRALAAQLEERERKLEERHNVSPVTGVGKAIKRRKIAKKS